MIDPFLLAETYYDENEKYLDNLDPGWAKAAHFFRTGIGLAMRPAAQGAHPSLS
jgi:hypothetical protein